MANDAQAELNGLLVVAQQHSATIHQFAKERYALLGRGAVISVPIDMCVARNDAIMMMYMTVDMLEESGFAQSARIGQAVRPIHPGGHHSFGLWW